MDFTNQMPEWENEGAEPSTEIKTNGFQAGYKPPAGIFNWFFSLFSKAIKEIQEGLSKVDNTPDSEKSVNTANFASEAGVGRKVQYPLTVKFNGGDTENTDKWTFDGSTSRTVNITPAKIGAAKDTDLDAKVDKTEGIGLMGFGTSADGSGKTRDTIMVKDSITDGYTIKKIATYLSDLKYDGFSPVTATSTDGVTYTATVDGITELYNGLELTVIFNTANTNTAPTLNINGLGAVKIRRPLSFNTLATNAPEVGYIGENRAIKLLYDSEYVTGGIWRIVGSQKVSGSDIYGDVPIVNGGTGASTAEEALTNLGVADYVIEQGESDIWKYSKWNSGKIEIWGAKTFTDVQITHSTNIGSFVSESITIALPVTVYTNLVASLTNASGGIWLTQYNESDLENISFRANAMQSCEKVVHARIYAWSTWK